MNRTRFSRSLALIAVLIAGCGGAPVSVAPAAVSSGQTTLKPSANGAAASASPTSSAAVKVLDGEAWVLYTWYLPGKNTRDLFLARPDGSLYIRNRLDARRAAHRAVSDGTFADLA